MDFNDGNWKFRGAISVLKTGKTYSLPWSFTCKNVAIDANFREVKPNWYRAGYVGFESNGLQVPNGEPLSFGRSVLTAPDFPDGQSYRIKFTPVQWLGPGRLRCWEFIPTRKLTRPEPINTKEFTSQEIDLLMASGLDPAKLRLSPESLEIVLPLLISLRSPSDGSISTQLTTIIEELRTMANTDIRSFKKMLTDLSTQVSDQALDIATTGAKVVSMEATMVIENTFSVLKAAFSLAGDFWVYDLVHDMNTLTPDVSIYDTDPATGKPADLQLIQTTAISPNSLRIELNSDEYSGDNFPLAVVVQARNSTPVVVGTWKALGDSGRSVKLEGGSLMVSQIGNTTPEFDAFRDTVGGAITGILEGFVLPSGIFAAKTATGHYYGAVNGWSATPYAQSEYDLAKVQAGTIAL